jgi:hypothetical protein
MSDRDQEKLEKLKETIADAKHMSKPDAENATVVRDADGRWIFEIYTAGHTWGPEIRSRQTPDPT